MKQKSDRSRILCRLLAKELSTEEMELVRAADATVADGDGGGIPLSTLVWTTPPGQEDQ